MVKMISFDLEYNKKREVLSAGLIELENFTISFIEELFFNNKSDSDTYKIHGLNNDFLSKYGKDSSEIQILNKKLLEQDYLIGFDLKHDLKVLNLNYRKLFSKHKIIDLKLILELFDLNISLSKLLEKTNLMEKYKSLLPIHTSIMDSFLTYTFLDKLILSIQSTLNISKEDILKDLAIMSTTVFQRESWRYDFITDKYYFLRSFFSSVKNNHVNKISKTIFKVLEVNGNIELYNKDYYMIGKYKKEDYKEKYQIDEIKTIKKSFNLGFRDLV